MSLKLGTKSFRSLDQRRLEIRILIKDPLPQGFSIPIIEIQEQGSQVRFHHLLNMLLTDCAGQLNKDVVKAGGDAFLNCGVDLIVNGDWDKFTNLNSLNENERWCLHNLDNPSLYLKRFNVTDGNLCYIFPINSQIQKNRIIQRTIINDLYPRSNGRMTSVLPEVLQLSADLIKPELNILSDLGLVEYDSIKDSHVRLTAKGRERFERLHTGFGQSVFMIAWCDPTIDWLIQYCKHLIEDEFHYQFYFQEREEPRSDIASEIKEKIQNCTFIIADLTAGRENCLYELGYAHALHKRVIVTRKASDIEQETKNGDKVWKLTFDINQYKHSKWKDEHDEDFKAELRTRISQTIKAIEQDYFSI